MDKRDVELVLEKSLEFWREKLHEQVSLVDIHVLASRVWREIQVEVEEEEEYREYFLSKPELDDLMEYGELEWEDDDGIGVILELMDDPMDSMILESGKIMMWGREER